MTIAAACVLALIIGGGGALYAANSADTKNNTAAGPSNSTLARSPSPENAARSSTTHSSPPPSGTAITTALLRALGDCGSTCIITGKVKFQDPVAGPSTLITTLAHAGGTVSSSAHIVIVDAAGHKEWDDDLGSMYVLAPAPVPIDATGHIFLNYNPGRYNGVIVLASTGDGVDDFKSLPTPAKPEGRFYSATATDTDKNGTFDIDVAANNCVPDCASGTDVHTVYHWTGTAYVAPNTARTASPSTAQAQVAKLDCKVLSFGADNLQFEVSPGPGTYGHARVTLIEQDRGIVFPDKPTVTVYAFGSESNFHPVPLDDTGASAEPDSCTATATG